MHLNDGEGIFTDFCEVHLNLTFGYITNIGKHLLTFRNWKHFGFVHFMGGVSEIDFVSVAQWEYLFENNTFSRSRQNVHRSENLEPSYECWIRLDSTYFWKCVEGKRVTWFIRSWEESTWPSRFLTFHLRRTFLRWIGVSVTLLLSKADFCLERAIHFMTSGKRGLNRSERWHRVWAMPYH